MMTLGQRLQIAREHAKITQDELAKKAGVRQSAVSRIERGLAFNSGYAVLFAKICGVRPQWLALEDGDMIDFSSDPKINIVLKVMEKLPEYKKDVLVHTSNALSEQPPPNNTAPHDRRVNHTGNIDRIIITPDYTGPDRRKRA